jgi:hypothetical protein
MMAMAKSLFSIDGYLLMHSLGRLWAIYGVAEAMPFIAKT